jgi:hypothetical protein
MAYDFCFGCAQGHRTVRFLLVLLLAVGFCVVAACSSGSGSTEASGDNPPEESGGGSLPSCEDGIQNQDETGVDCGGVCGAC